MIGGTYKNKTGSRQLSPCGKVVSYIRFPALLTKGVKFKIHERQKHDATLQLHRRENSVNMNLEVEDPLYAKVQRRGTKDNNNRQGPNSKKKFLHRVLN